MTPSGTKDPSGLTTDTYFEVRSLSPDTGNWLDLGRKFQNLKEARLQIRKEKGLSAHAKALKWRVYRVRLVRNRELMK